MTHFRLLFVLVIVMLTAQPAAAQSGLPLQCLQSFNVKDKGYTLGSKTLSCRLTEVRRDELFAKINATPETGEIDGGKLAAELLVLEKKLAEEAGKKNWGSLANAVTGNALATIGLTACVETALAGCAVAVVGKILSFVGIIDTASSESDRVAAATSMQKELERIRIANQNKKSAAKVVRDRMIAEFTQMCEAVRANCL